jgi:hypothetical protein
MARYRVSRRERPLTASRSTKFEKPHLPPGTGSGKGIKLSRRYITEPIATSMESVVILFAV